jgi:hypothetical protein
MSKSIHTLMVEAGQEVSNWQSDLYVPVNDTTTAIIKDYEFKCNVSRFKSNVDGKSMYEIPFAYEPYWTNKGVI